MQSSNKHQHEYIQHQHQRLHIQRDKPKMLGLKCQEK